VLDQNFGDLDVALLCGKDESGFAEIVLVIDLESIL